MEEAGLWPADINMEITEIVLLIIGAVVVVVSFLIPEKQVQAEDKSTQEWEERVKRFFLQQVKAAKGGLEEQTDEVLSASGEKAERCMERIANEKIMAVQEYSDTVLEQIHKNHEEAVFLYDMLNSKHDQIKFTAKEINTAIEDSKKNLENVTRDVLQDILEGSVQNDLQKQIEHMLTETVEDAIKVSVQGTLNERIQTEVYNCIQSGVGDILPVILSEELESKVQELLPAILERNGLAGGLPEETGVQETFVPKAPVKNVSEQKVQAEEVFVQDASAKEAELNENWGAEEAADNFVGENLPQTARQPEKDEAFQELELSIPEVIMQEEESFVVQSVKKVSPKKRNSGKKTSNRRNTENKKAQSKESSPQILPSEKTQPSAEIPAISETPSIAGKEFGGNSNNGNNNGNNKEKILQLHKEGKSHMDIARELGLGIGEVKLVIGLFDGA